MDDVDLESLTRAQINLLNERALRELSAQEKLQFANLAPRPIPATKVGLPDELMFKLNPSKIATEKPERRLELANDAQRMNMLRAALLQLHGELLKASPEEARAVSTRKEALGNEGRELFARLKQFQ
jgi:hypothetical protein